MNEKQIKKAIQECSEKELEILIYRQNKRIVMLEKALDELVDMNKELRKEIDEIISKKLFRSKL